MMSLRANAIVLIALTLARPAVADPAESVTTDTPEYCHMLHTRVMEALQGKPPAPSVVSLTQEGMTMCDQGQTRAGILRLRRALLWERAGGIEPAR